MNTRTLLLSLSLAQFAWPQAMTEYGALTAASAKGAAGVGKAASGIAGALEKSTGALSGTNPKQTTTRTKAASHSGKRAAAPVPPDYDRGVEDARSAVNPNDVQPGMSREELIALAGKPWVKITIPEDDSHLLERYSYLLKAGGNLEVVLRDGAVAEVKPVQQ